MKDFRRKKEGGFTLVELMIVIAIIGILAAIAIPQFSAYRERGFIASMQSDISSMRNAEEAYFADKSTYTTATTDLANYGFKGLSQGSTATITAVTNLATDYKVVVNSTKTSKTVTFDSTLGTTVTQ